MIPPTASLLRVYLNANESRGGKPLYQTLVEKARTLKFAGASVFPVELSYGAHHRLRDATSEYASFELPVVIEMIESTERVGSLSGELTSIITEGLVTVGPVRVLHCVRRDKPAQKPMPTHAIVLSIGEIHAAKESAAQMHIQGNAQRLTVYIGSSDTWQGRNFAVAIVEQCRQMGMAGATVSRGVMGFGGHSVIHRAHLLGLSTDLPERIEIIERPNQIERLLPVLHEMVGSGLIITEDVQVV